MADVLCLPGIVHGFAASQPLHGIALLQGLEGPSTTCEHILNLCAARHRTGSSVQDYRQPSGFATTAPNTLAASANSSHQQVYS
jgi:hypothetical protein